MKNLLLTKTPIGSKGMYHYKVVEEGKVLAERKSKRDYVAAAVQENGDGTYSAGYFFGRLDLIGKGDSSHSYGSWYGIATTAGTTGH